MQLSYYGAPYHPSLYASFFERSHRCAKHFSVRRTVITGQFISRIQ